MPVFKYSGRTTAGSHKKGTINAQSEKAAISKLRDKALIREKLKNPRVFFIKNFHSAVK